MKQKPYRKQRHLRHEVREDLMLARPFMFILPTMEERIAQCADSIADMCEAMRPGEAVTITRYAAGRSTDPLFVLQTESDELEGLWVDD